MDKSPPQLYRTEYVGSRDLKKVSMEVGKAGDGAPAFAFWHVCPFLGASLVERLISHSTPEIAGYSPYRLVFRDTWLPSCTGIVTV